MPRLLKEEALETSMSGLSLGDKTQVALLHKKSSDNDSKIKSKKGDAKQKLKKFNGTCYRCGKFGHRKSECRKPRSETTTGKTSIKKKKNNDLLMVKANEDNNITEVWFADTGASHHMSPRRELF